MTDQLGAMLVVKQGMPDTSVIPLDQPACLLGKSPTADIVIDNPYVSRRHSQIVQTGDSFQIEDLGSKNGTFVNGVRLQRGALKLNSGDRIELARERVVLRFQEAGTTATLPPMPQAAPMTSS